MLHLCFSSDPATVDPRKNSEIYSSALQFMLYEGLTRLLPEGEVELALAKKVDCSEDLCTYTFHLREACWSDGAPITAADFELAWKKVLTPEFASPCPHLFYTIVGAEEASQGKLSPEKIGVKALGPRTLQVHLKHPTPYFLSLISFCNFFPIPSHIEKKDPSWFLKADASLVTNGPFRLKKWDRQREIVVEKNPLYWDRDQVLLPGIEIKIVKEEKTALRLFEKGEIDLLTTVTSPLSLDDLASLRSKLNLQPIGGTLFCTFQLDHPYLRHPKLRKALSLAIDREKIVRHITQLSEETAHRVLPPVVMEGKDRSLLPSYDPERARELFQEALEEMHLSKEGLAAKTPLLFEGNELQRRLAQAMQEEWRNGLGVLFPLEEVDFKTERGQLEGKTYAMGLAYWIVQYHDPMNVLERFRNKEAKKNFPGFDHPAYRECLDRACATKDLEKRKVLLEEAETILAEELPLLPLFHFNQAVLENHHFTNLQFSPLGNLIYKKVRPRQAA